MSRAYQLLRQGTGVMLTVALALAVTVAILFVVNQVPRLLQGETTRQPQRYETIAAAEAALRQSVALPAYFPDRLAWPPAQIVGQVAPVPRLSLYISSQDGEENTLVLHQVFGSREPEPPLSPLVQRPQTRSHVLLGERRAELVSGEGDDGRFYSQLSWQQDSTEFILLTQLSADELVRIAHSFAVP